MWQFTLFALCCLNVDKVGTTYCTLCFRFLFRSININDFVMNSEDTFYGELLSLISTNISSRYAKDQRSRFISHNKTTLLLARIEKFLLGIRIIKGEFAMGIFTSLYKIKGGYSIKICIIVRNARRRATK